MSERPPEHHDRPMYHDEHDGTDMQRWLCSEPGCGAVLPDETLAMARTLGWDAVTTFGDLS